MAAKVRHKRVNFQLPISLAHKFEFAARKRGITKAKLLRSWLHGLPPFVGNPCCLDEEVTSFNCRLARGFYKELTLVARRHGLTRSAYIRAVVSNYLHTKNIVVHYSSEAHRIDEANKLLKLGELKEATDILISRIEILKPEEQLRLAHGLVDFGDLQKASQVLDHLEGSMITKTRSEQVFAGIDEIRGQIARHNRDIILSTKLFNTALTLAKQHEHDYLVGRILLQLGVLSEMQENIEEAIVFTEKSLEYLSVNENPAAYLKGYLRLSNLYAVKSDEYQVGKYVDKASDILMISGEVSSNVSSRIHNRLALSSMRIGKLARARKHLDFGIRSMRQATSQKELRYNLELAGVLELLQGDSKLGVEHLRRAEALEERFRERMEFSKSTLFRLYWDAHTDYDNSIKQMREIVELQHRPIYKSLGQYVLYSTMFLLGDNEQRHSVLGENRLRDLALSAPSQMVRKRAAFTLQHNRLNVVI